MNRKRATAWLVVVVVGILRSGVCQEEVVTTTTADDGGCAVEPWGRYSASGSLVTLGEERFLYSFGGDTRSNGDTRGGGVVRTNFRFSLSTTNCWERLPDAPVEVGYRGTATLVGDRFYIFGGGDRALQAVNHMWTFDVNTREWNELTHEVAPAPRYKHATVQVNSTHLLMIGGRGFGTIVHSDVWLYDTDHQTWSLWDESVLSIYRHAVAYDPGRGIVWIHGGLDGTLTRTDLLYEYDWRRRTLTLLTTGAPGRRASHLLEYLPDRDALLVYGGTCQDDAGIYLYNVSTQEWCEYPTEPATRPSRRDAFLWGVDYPYLYLYSGDVICVRIGNVYGTADVHRLDLREFEWELVYNPRNERAPGLTDVCVPSRTTQCRAPTHVWDANDLVDRSGGMVCEAMMVGDGEAPSTGTTDVEFESPSMAPNDTSLVDSTSSVSIGNPWEWLWSMVLLCSAVVA